MSHNLIRFVIKQREKAGYLLVGLWNFIFGYSAFVALYLILGGRAHYNFLLVISYVLSITNAYIAYKLFVFRTKGEYLREYLRFYVVYGGLLAINLLFLPFFVEIFSISPMIAQAGLAVFTVLFSYYGHRNFSFKPAAALAILLALSAAVWGEEINISGRAYDWKPANPQAVVSADDTTVKVSSGGGWAGVYNQRMAGALLEENDLLAFELKTTASGIATVFWANYLDQRFLPQRSYQFYLGSPGRWHLYYIDLSAQEKDLTRIDNILINPLTGPGEAEIRDVRIVKGGVTGKLLAGWQEFLGPRGREVVGYTINTMPSVRLFGRELFIYIYWLVFLAAAGLLANELWPVWRQPKKIWPAYGRAVKKIFIFVFALWAALELSSLYTDWRNLRGDLPLAGKSLDEKRTLVNSGDFYPFIKFCGEKLPAGAVYDLKVAGMYNDIKAIYYLYPHSYSTTEADYLIVYDQEPDSRYAQFAVFRPKAVIMKKVKG